MGEGDFCCVMGIFFLVDILEVFFIGVFVCFYGVYELEFRMGLSVLFVVEKYGCVVYLEDVV